MNLDLHSKSVIARISCLAALLALPLQAAGPQAGSKAAAVEKLPDGIVLRAGENFLKIEVCADDVIRVAYAPDRAFFARKSLMTAPRKPEKPVWKLETTTTIATLSTARLQAKVDLSDATVTFCDAQGNPVLAERKAGRTLKPVIVQGDRTFHVRQQWESPSDEALYGLGQHQFGLLNIKGYDLELWQRNTGIAIPFLTSSRGYGILWDNTSMTKFGDIREFEPIPSGQLIDADGQPGGLTGTYFQGDLFEKQVARRTDAKIAIEVDGKDKEPNKAIHPALAPTGNVSVRWEGEIDPKETGDYTIATFSNNGIKVWVNDRLVISRWRQGWLPEADMAKVPLEAGKRARIKVEWAKEQGGEIVRLLWKTPSQETGTSLWSQVGEGIDYYFCYGPQIDKVIAGYRRLTGGAPMMPVWAYGLWQCRQRYKTAQESLDVLEGYRSRGIPIDNIVQDWYYWKDDAWGSHEFDPARFPDPVQWIKDIHDKYHARLMISVWPKFYAGTKNFEEMRRNGFLYEPNLGEDMNDWLGYPAAFYDAFNPAAGKLFWAQMDRELFKKGIDAWWLDASEPDLLPRPILKDQRSHLHPTALGTGARMLNAYPLMNAKSVYEGQRATAPGQRVFILTRSGFAGQQHYAGAVWSGDITSTWETLRAQIPAGLGYALSGMPYWTTDIGGFSVPAKFSKKDRKPEDAEEWNELNTRWFQFGTFVPLLRVHGEEPFREMWEFGGDKSPAYQAMLKFDRLRYTLLPYIYSAAGAVTHESGTIMRPLVMDFPGDPSALDVKDEYLFGPSLLVCPVTAHKARTRPAYLPAAAGGWYDFWTGSHLDGGQTVEAPAPLDAIPVYARAGSIIPTGPDLQYTQEKPADPLTIVVYAGADGTFTLYEDDGLTYGYEQNELTRIPLRWDDAARTLTIGQREGSFKGMPAKRTFHVVLVTKDKPAGFPLTAGPDRSTPYDGQAVTLKF